MVFKKGQRAWNKGMPNLLQSKRWTENNPSKNGVWNKGLKGDEYKNHYKNGFKNTFQEGHKMHVGKKHSTETRKKQSETRKKLYKDGIIKVIKYWSGKKNPEHSKRMKGSISWNFIDGKASKRKRPNININGRTVQLSHYVWLKHNQLHRLPEGCVIHHIDYNPENNNIDNLQLMDKKFHNQLHSYIIKQIKGGNLANY